MTIYAIGSRVLMGPRDAPIQAQIIGVWIRTGDYVTYNVTWWNGRTREDKWVEEAEIRMQDEQGFSRVAIGFHGAPSQCNTGKGES